MLVVDLISRGQVITNEEAGDILPKYSIAIGARESSISKGVRLSEPFLHIRPLLTNAANRSLVEVNCFNQSVNRS